MKIAVAHETGAPKGNGPQGGYSLGQAMEMHLRAVDFLAEELEDLKQEIKYLKKHRYQERPM